jgi:intein-encoded DNA endonuclease-like protein
MNLQNKIPMERFELTEDFTYCLGVLYGDCSCGKEGNAINSICIKLEVKDKDFVESFKKAFCSWSGLKGNPIHQHKNDGMWVTRFSSCDLKPFINSNLEKIKKSDKKIIGAFLRGLYDSEGCVCFSKNDYSRKVAFCNSNLKILKLCRILLKKLGIESNMYLYGKAGDKQGYSILNEDYYQIHISGRYNLMNFLNNVGFTIQRKQDSLKNMVDSYIYETEKIRTHSGNGLLIESPI